MNLAKYSIIGNGERWCIDVNGDRQGDYETKEAAFESAVAAASNAIKKGMAVEVTVPEARGEGVLG